MAVPGPQDPGRLQHQGVDLIAMLARDGLTFAEAFDAINFDDEALARRSPRFKRG